jgi:hypothetical protein
MRAHEFASYLTKLAKILKEGPNFDFDEMHEVGSFYRYGAQQKSSKKEQSENLPIALNALLSLSSIDKNEWAKLIFDLGLPIEIRSRDASRDLLGKVLKLLGQDPEARDRLTRKVKHSGDRASPELMRALSSLLTK